MIVNQQALQGIYVSFNTLFNKTLSETKTFWDKIATRVPSSTGEESYKWLGDIPKMREWIGDKQIQNLSAHDYTIKNKDFELTVNVKRNDIEDDRIGLYSPMIQTVAQSAATFADDLVFGVLKAGFSEKCFDKQPFYSKEHKIGKKSAANTGTKKLTVESYADARSIMMSYTDEHGRPLRLVPNLLLVPPALESRAREILLADQINGSTNTYKGTAELHVVPELADEPTAWHLLCTTRPIKPVIYQERTAPKFVSLDKDTDANVFYRAEYVYGAEARGNAGYGFWQMAFGSTGTTN